MGIIRRVDELGRIVIPREVRIRTKIQYGDALEITDRNGEIVITPYDEKGEYIKRLKRLVADMKEDTNIGARPCSAIDLINAAIRELDGSNE